jgi:hypothetical protein
MNRNTQELFAPFFQNDQNDSGKMTMGEQGKEIIILEQEL